MILRPKVVRELAAFGDYLAGVARQITRAVHILTPAKCDAAVAAGSSLAMVPHLQPCQHVAKPEGPWVGLVSAPGRGLTVATVSGRGCWGGGTALDIYLRV